MDGTLAQLLQQLFDQAQRLQQLQQQVTDLTQKLADAEQPKPAE